MTLDDLVGKGRNFLLLLCTAAIIASCSTPPARNTPSPTATERPVATRTYTPSASSTVTVEQYPELRAYQAACSTPVECAKLLFQDWTYYIKFDEDYRRAHNGGQPPAASLVSRRGACGSIGYAIAAGVADDGIPSTFLILISENYPSHQMFVYQDSDGMWGYTDSLLGDDFILPNDHKPSYRTIEELFSDYNISLRSGVYNKYYLITEKDLHQIG